MKIEKMLNKVFLETAGNFEYLKQIPDNSVDLMVTDPPYGIGFMGKDWDKALPNKTVWQECLRVLKDGAFAFVMCIPRQDCLSRMIVNLEDAGFKINFTPIYHTFASGFPKAQNIGKAVNKQECRKELIKKLRRKPTKDEFEKYWENYRKKLRSIQAIKLDGSYSYNPKPAVEVIVVAQKPKTTKTYVNQALLWYEERQAVLRGLATELKKCYNVEDVEWEDMP